MRRDEPVPGWATPIEAALGTPIVSWRPLRAPGSHRTGVAATADGDVVVKDLGPDSLSRNAAIAKGRRRSGHREMRAYDLLASSGCPPGPPAVRARVVDQRSQRYLLGLEFVVASPLTEVGDLDRWLDAVRWLASFHLWSRRTFESDPVPWLTGRGATRLRSEAVELLAVASVGCLPRVLALSDAVGAAAQILTDAPEVLVHGECFGSNVLVGPGGRVAVVDWETIGVGSAAFDLASLAVGWDSNLADFAAAYEAVAPGLLGSEPEDALHAARLGLAVQRLAAPSAWCAPAEHRTDWLTEAESAAAALGLRR
jgi:aminoglycoside phosphotransferase (APT) family kinase protein